MRSDETHEPTSASQPPFDTTPSSGWRRRLGDALTRDAKVARRALLGAPGFAITVIATLVLGIGAAVTIFSVVDHVLVRPLAYPNADRIVTLYQLGKSGNIRLVSNPTLQDWARADVGLSGVAWIRGDGLTLERPDECEILDDAPLRLLHVQRRRRRPTGSARVALGERTPSGALDVSNVNSRFHRSELSRSRAR